MKKIHPPMLVMASECPLCSYPVILLQLGPNLFAADAITLGLAGELGYRAHDCPALEGSPAATGRPARIPWRRRLSRAWRSIRHACDPCYDTRIGHGPGCACDRCQSIRTEQEAW